MEPNRGNDHNKNKRPEGDRPKHNYFTPLMIALVLVLIFSWVMNAVEKSQYTETRWDEFVEAKNTGNLSEVEIQVDRVLYMTKEEAAKEASQQKACYTGLPSGNVMELANELEAMGVSVKKVIVEDNSMIMMILSYAIMIGGMFLLMNMLTRRMGGDGMMGGFGKSKAKVYMQADQNARRCAWRYHNGNHGHRARAACLHDTAACLILVPCCCCC